MALTKFDPLTALIVVDLQKGITAMPSTPYPIAEVVARSAQLARAFRKKGLPVVLVNVKGGAPGRTESGPMGGVRAADWADLVPELEVQPSDHLVTKMQWGAFEGTSLDQYLRRLGVTQVVITGVATCIGVESTARAAHEHGYNVTLAIDAMTDRDAASHQHSIEKIFPRLGETATTEVLLQHLS